MGGVSRHPGFCTLWGAEGSHLARPRLRGLALSLLPHAVLGSSHQCEETKAAWEGFCQQNHMAAGTRADLGDSHGTTAPTWGGQESRASGQDRATTQPVHLG